MAIVDGRANFTISREALFAVIRSNERLFTDETLADAIHAAFCQERGFSGLSGEIHRRSHLELARTIMAKAQAVKG